MLLVNFLSELSNSQSLTKYIT